MDNVIIENLINKKYKHINKFKLKYLGRHDYLYLSCNICLDISYANNTLDILLAMTDYPDLQKLQNISLMPGSNYKFEFNLNPYND